MLKGEKVVLRSISRADLPRLCDFNNNVEVELAGGGEPPVPQSLERLEAEFDQDASQGGRDGSRFAIEADGELIGQCGLRNFDQAAHTCELGITIGDPNYWGRGYGRDAVKLLLDYAFRLRNIRKVWLRVDGSNERAYRAYRACGFVEEARQRDQVWNAGAYTDLVYMGVFSHEWQKKDAKSR
jgi:RimJ/RimL family protein N-acetyltransferase